jgi:hypothetical protein
MFCQAIFVPVIAALQNAAKTGKFASLKCNSASKNCRIHHQLPENGAMSARVVQTVVA